MHNHSLSIFWNISSSSNCVNCFNLVRNNTNCPIANKTNQKIWPLSSKQHPAPPIHNHYSLAQPTATITKMKPITTLKPYNNNNKINKTTSATTTTLSKTREKQKHLSKQIKERSSSFFLFAFCTHSYHVTFIIFTEILFFLLFLLFLLLLLLLLLVSFPLLLLMMMIKLCV